MNLKRLSNCKSAQQRVVNSRRIKDESKKTFFVEDLLDKYAFEFIDEHPTDMIFPMSDLESYLNESPENQELFNEMSYDYFTGDNEEGEPFNENREWFIDDGKSIISIDGKDLGKYVWFEYGGGEFVTWCREKHYVGYQDDVKTKDNSVEFDKMQNPQL